MQFSLISTRLYFLSFFIGIVGVRVANAEETADAKPQDAQTEEAIDTQAATTSPPGESNDLTKLQEQMAEMQKKIEQQSREIATLKQSTVKLADVHEEDLDNVEGNVEEVERTTDETLKLGRLLSIFGFFDLTFFKGFFDKNSFFNVYVPKHGSFSITSANIYFKSEMTDQLSAVTELKFSFLPHGKETSYAYQTILPDGTVVDVPEEYRRVDTTVLDPITTMEFQQGGVTLERIHLTYSPFDWLNVLAGRYLTPYGIWNVDHGSPVVLMARIPMLQYRKLVPLAQTGLQLFGRFFPSDKVLIDYAVTLSNGRSPIDAIYDLDENKGLGLRLKLTYSGRLVSFFAGTYGYMGDGTDVEKQLVMHINDNAELDETMDNPARLRIIKTSAYREYAMSYDLSLSFLNITLQAEAAVNRTRYSKNTPMGELDSGLNGGSLVEKWYMPSYTGYGAYVLLAYELPVPVVWLTVTPYIVIEKCAPYEVVDLADVETLTGGVNFKPSPYVTVKGEYNFSHSDTFGKMHGMTFQMAVSF